MFIPLLMCTIIGSSRPTSRLPLWQPKLLNLVGRCLTTDWIKGLLSFAVKKKQYTKLHNYAKLYIYVPDVDTQTYCVLLLLGTYVYGMVCTMVILIWSYKPGASLHIPPPINVVNLHYHSCLVTIVHLWFPTLHKQGAEPQNWQWYSP